MTRKTRPLTELITANNFPDLSWDHPLDYPNDDPNIPDCLDEQILDYDFIRPIHYEKIPFDPNLSKLDTKKLQHDLADEYQIQSSSSKPIEFSKLCWNLIEKNLLILDKTELISAFYCMLNNCNKKHLFMRNYPQQDDLVIQTQPFSQSNSLSYSHRIFL